MLEFQEFKQKLQALLLSIKEIGSSIDLEGLKAQLKELETKTLDSNFYLDMHKSQTILKQIKQVRTKINSYLSLLQKCEDAFVLTELSISENDVSQMEEIQSEIKQIAQMEEKLRLGTLLNKEYDANNAILTLHAGAGGTEAQDWVQMLYRMYTMWCEDNGCSIKVLDLLQGSEAGIKSITFLVCGTNAYGYLKSEKGVHRLVRISPFDSNARRHTSFCSLDVIPEIEDDVSVVINPDEIRIDTYRASGAGGQHVNKTDSAIRITHLCSGIVVQCQNERSQLQNKETAMKMLKSKLLEIKMQESMDKISQIKGEMKKIEWGSQIRSYVFHPYTMVKDHRTGAETGNVSAVMNGDINLFINEYLKKS